MARSSVRTIAAAVAAIALTSVGTGTPAAAQNHAADLPHLISHHGHHALIVDGAPFLMLGAQANNSSNYPSALPKVWPVLDQLHANTLEIPVAWQQVEPVEGQFDFSWVETLLSQARAHDKRLVLLWFGTWKNTNPNYTPAWVLTNNRRFPRMKTPDGTDSYALSPMYDATLQADKRAFVELMTYLKAHDPQNTVIMVQVENETGSYGNPRDYGAKAQKLFDGPVPAALVKKLGKRPGTWAQLFGEQADRAFNTWYTARYVGQIAAAGKAIKPLPMYVNAALGGAFEPPNPTAVSSGGPQWDVVDIWKAGAPAIDIEAPDIYDPKSDAYAAYLDHYDRSDNPLFVPETGNAAKFARYFWSVLGHGAIGFAPFGMDATGYYNYPLGGGELGPDIIHAFASKYALLAPIDRKWADIAFHHDTWGCSRPDDGAAQSETMGAWTITAKYGQWQFGADQDGGKGDSPPWADKLVGGCLVAALDANTFLVTGDHVRLHITASATGPKHPLMVRVEQGHFDHGNWVVDRVWNGDQTDYGLNFIDTPYLLKVTMGSYR
jgi:beta-galactosidase GanA